MANIKYKMIGNDRIPNYSSELEIDVDDRYEAYSKPIPEPTPFEDGFITWFNAFGVREKASLKDANVTYNVTLRALPAGKRLFVLYDGKPQEITPKAAGRGKIQFSLSIGDPPTGAYP